MVVRKLGFDKWERVEANKSSGGLLCLWKDEVEIVVEWKLDNLICSTVKDFNKKDL